MEKEVAILTLSEKWGEKCIAAYDFQCNCLIRLVSEPEHGGGIPSSLVCSIDCLDIVRIKIKGKCPLEHQTENVLVDLEYGFRKTTSCISIETILPLIKIYPTIFSDSGYRICDVSHIDHSLEIVEFTCLEIGSSTNSCGKVKTKASFIYNGIYQANYSVTDSMYFGKKLTIPSGYMVISLPPSDDFTRNGNGYYKYVSAIYY